MAKYDVVSLNYMASGKSRGLVNVDVRRQAADWYYLGTEDAAGDLCALCGADAACFDISATTGRRDFDRRVMSKTFVFDRRGSRTVAKQKNMLSAAQSGVATDPLYDIRDVCIKSPIRKSYSENTNLPYTDRDVDIYAPSLEDEPVGFVGAGGRAVLLTQPTAEGAVTLSSCLNDPNAGFDLTYKMEYASAPLETVLYRMPGELCSECSSYGQYFKLLGDAYGGEDEYQRAAMSAFEPFRKFTSLKYNYIVDMEQDQKTLKYDDGNVFGIAVKGKNCLDSTYSQQASPSALTGCRRYVGVIETGGKTYLKYVDNVSADIRGNSGHADPNYQKIEAYVPANTLETARHKSNLFSIKIRNVPLSDSSINAQADQDAKDQLEQVRRDVKNIIFDIVKNVCPANTQLFDVFFESE